MRKIRKDDLVKVITGKDKDKQGKVLHVDTKKGKILVEGCNMVTKQILREASSRRKLSWTSPMSCW